MAFSFEPFLAISAGHFMAVSAGPEHWHIKTPCIYDITLSKHGVFFCLVQFKLWFS